MPDIQHDPARAFMPYPRVPVPHAATGPLAGLSFGVKDLFHVAGYPTSGGQPLLLALLGVQSRTAPTVQKLLDAGARFAGKTITDELAFSMNGQNAHFGSPVNGAAPERITGGSSCGSAAAVSHGLCDLALGTDTGGSVRVPASFCGLYGIRPTHGRIDVTGMLPQAPTSDTTGWFACDAVTFARVSAAMLGEAISAALPSRLVIATDTFGFADPAVAAALQPLVKKLAALVGASREDVMAPQGLSVWARAQRSLQPYEALATFKGWLDERNPRMAFSVARGLVTAAMIPESERAWAALMRQEARGRMAHLLPPGTILCLPTTPFPAPLRGQPLSILDPLRDRITCLCAQGGLAGHPQVNLPGATVDGLPVGLSIIGPRGSDATLVAVAQAMERHP